MKNVSTGFGLCAVAVAALAYPFVSSLAPSANANSVVWYSSDADSQLPGARTLWRAWSDGRIEVCRVEVFQGYSCNDTLPPCRSPWRVINDPTP